MRRTRTHAVGILLLAVSPVLAGLSGYPASAEEQSSATLKGLPLIEAPAPQGGRLAVIVSGDGGWTAIDREIAAAFVAESVAVVGLNSLKYFWKKRDADSAARDLETILRHYLDKWQRQEAILVGYSFGADTLPFMASRLPADLKSKVRCVALLGLSKSATFEFHVTDWLGLEPRGAFPTDVEIGKLSDLKVLCLYGDDEKDAFCRTLRGPHITAQGLPGGHHFAGNYRGAARIILDAVR